MRAVLIASIILFSAASSANADLIKCEMRAGDTYVESINGELSVKELEPADLGYTVYRVDGSSNVKVVDASVDFESEQEAVENLDWTFLDGNYYGLGLAERDGVMGILSTVLSQNKSVATMTALVAGTPILVHLERECRTLD